MLRLKLRAIYQLLNCYFSFTVDSKSKDETCFPRQPRTVGLSIVPGEHIRNLSIAKDYPTQTYHIEPISSSDSEVSTDYSADIEAGDSGSGNGLTFDT